jgi:hypothetical protein
MSDLSLSNPVPARAGTQYWFRLVGALKRRLAEARAQHNRKVLDRYNAPAIRELARRGDLPPEVLHAFDPPRSWSGELAGDLTFTLIPTDRYAKRNSR